MAKLVDALLSGGSAARCAGSSPVLGTNFVRGGDNCPVGEIGSMGEGDGAGAFIAVFLGNDVDTLLR